MRRALVVLVIALGACAETTSTPVVVPTDQIPFRLSREVEAIRPPARTQRVTLSFVRRGKLVSVGREVSTRLTSAETALRALLSGPDAREHQRGITTEIPDDTRLLSVEILDQIADVNLSREFQSPAPSGSILLRVAQVVRTTASIAGVTAVRFSIDGEPVSVVTDSGRSVGRPVSPLDYSSVIPRQTT